MKQKVRKMLGLIACGAAMGACDVVPGVSGGTMAFLLGIYEELITSIRAIGQPPFWHAVLKLRWKSAWKEINGNFLLAVGMGIALAVVSLAKLIEYLLAFHPVSTWSFFFGLVLASVVMVGKRIPRWNTALILALLIGTAVAYLIVGLVPVQTPEAPWFLVLSGAIAICAMILPGISGAFLLVLLGKYQYILSAVNDRDIVTLLYVAIGAAAGIILFAQVLGWLFRRYHDLTVALLTGLMLGSLRKVWPWKADIEWIVNGDGEKFVTIQANLMPPLSAGVLKGLALMLAGFCLVLIIDRVAHLSGKS